MERESLEFDVLIIGAGPAGLSAAIRLSQLNRAKEQDFSICVLEKGAYVGAHILSGAVIEPQALQSLLPDIEYRSTFHHTDVTRDEFWLLPDETHAKRLPTPRHMHNQGNWIVSLSEVCRNLGEIAEQEGVALLSGFAGQELIFDNQGALKGIRAGDKGVNKEGQHTANFQPGVDLHAKYILLAEGCRGSLSEKIIQHFDLRANSQHQTYALGVKELWQVPEEQCQSGLVLHSIGWPLDNRTYGGSFVYHHTPNQISLGFVVGLDYTNPYLDPFFELQRFKTHPLIAHMLRDSKRIGYGARALNEGGYQSLPKLCFPGGLLLGCAAGMLNVPKIKGTHNAIHSGILAAEEVFAELCQGNAQTELHHYDHAIRHGQIGHELHRARNIRPGFKYGLWTGLALAALDTYIFANRTPWTLHHAKPDHEHLLAKQQVAPIAYDKPDNKLTFDKISSVCLSNTNHAYDQPCHLQLIDPDKAISLNWQHYGSPETRYCPVSVYELVPMSGQSNPILQINAQNCVHCKACDIKDPAQNIKWVPPEGSDGPHYSGM